MPPHKILDETPEEKKQRECVRYHIRQFSLQTKRRFGRAMHPTESKKALCYFISDRADAIRKKKSKDESKAESVDRAIAVFKQTLTRLGFEGLRKLGRGRDKSSKPAKVSKGAGKAKPKRRASKVDVDTESEEDEEGSDEGSSELGDVDLDISTAVGRKSANGREAAGQSFSEAEILDRMLAEQDISQHMEGLEEFAAHFDYPESQASRVIDLVLWNNGSQGGPTVVPAAASVSAAALYSQHVQPQLSVQPNAYLECIGTVVPPLIEYSSPRRESCERRADQLQSSGKQGAGQDSAAPVPCPAEYRHPSPTLGSSVAAAVFGGAAAGSVLSAGPFCADPSSAQHYAQLNPTYQHFSFPVYTSDPFGMYRHDYLASYSDSVDFFEVGAREHFAQPSLASFQLDYYGYSSPESSRFLQHSMQQQQQQSLQLNHNLNHNHQQQQHSFLQEHHEQQQIASVGDCSLPPMPLPLSGPAATASCDKKFSAQQQSSADSSVF